MIKATFLQQPLVMNDFFSQKMWHKHRRIEKYYFNLSLSSFNIPIIHHTEWRLSWWDIPWYHWWKAEDQWNQREKTSVKMRGKTLPIWRTSAGLDQTAPPEKGAPEALGFCDEEVNVQYYVRYTPFLNAKFIPYSTQDHLLNLSHKNRKQT